MYNLEMSTWSIGSSLTVGHMSRCATLTPLLELPTYRSSIIFISR